MVKSLRPLSAGSIVYVRSQQLHFLVGWARVRHCRRAGWIYRIGLEFRKPLFTGLYDLGEAGTAIALPPTLHSWRPSGVEYCFGQAAPSTEEGCEAINAEVRPEVSLPTGGAYAGNLIVLAQRKEFPRPASPDSQIFSDNSGEQREDEAATDLPQPELAHATGRNEGVNTTAVAQPASWDRSDLAAVVKAAAREHVGLNGDGSNGTNRNGVVCALKLEGTNERKTDGIAGDTGSAEPRNTGAHFDPARVAKQLRATTVASLMNELSVLKPQMFGDESEYARLSESHPDFLTFRIASLRPDLKRKVIGIRSSSKHIRLAQELAAAHYSKALATIQDDWKRCKPAEFRLGGSRSLR